MGMPASAANPLLLLIFNADNWANIADNAASSPLTNLYVALHTADPTSSGNQTTSEAAYTSYARVAVARTSSGWVVTGNSVSPVATVSFPLGTGGSGTAYFWSVGFAASGSSQILYVGTCLSPILMGSGITPQLSSGTTLAIQ